MKKILITLMAMTATSTFAQITISGTVSMGWSDSQITALPAAATFGAPGALTTNKSTAFNILQNLMGGSGGGYYQGGNGKFGAITLPAGESSGFGVDPTTQINFTANEDLGSGYKAIAKMGFSSLDRGQGVQGGDASLALLTPIGRVTLFDSMNYDYLSRGYASLGAPWMDGKVLPNGGFIKGVNFTKKLNEDLAIGFTHADAPQASAIQANPALLQLGGGESGGGTGVQRFNAINVNYSSGPLKVDGQYLAYDNQIFDPTGIGCDCTYRNIVRARGAYDFGSVQLGGGYMILTTSSGSTVTESLVAVSFPVGAWRFAADYTQNAINGSAGNISYVAVVGGQLPSAAYRNIGANTLDGTRSGYGLNAVYSFSKSTSASIEYTNWLYYSTALTGSAPSNNSQTKILLTKNF